MTEKDLIELIHSPRLEAFWYSVAEWMIRYFRLETEGLGHIPARGAAIIAPNHSGFAGLDVVMLAHILRKHLGERPRILAHRAYFDLLSLIRKISESFGLRPASVASGLEELKAGRKIMVFPEAEAGNFKSSFDMYRLQPFHSGFVRLALMSGAPIVPCLVIGAEESNFNIGNIDLSSLIRHLRVPIPLNIIPLPAKWKILFMEPIDLRGYPAKTARNRAVVMGLCEEIRKLMQQRLNDEIAKREFIYVPPPAKE